ncbi:hypothetical protein M407DRAFT_31004 [Tulasnella calospora MUT 4182]|uniref:Uncharacterized protein n=1 Tax=Tulasnella calospora MUT 4182 TaxID=1051891 RepID=A0A0C3PWH3_9AGAM|nr:hypothetical protein M407DRAFT_31004 [Tulasnella calospora MUT 4182]
MQSPNDYVFCTHCGKLLHRSTAFRHSVQAAKLNALAAALNHPPAIQPPPSSPTDSITSTERALSPLNFSELENMDMEIDDQPTGTVSEVEVESNNDGLLDVEFDV